MPKYARFDPSVAAPSPVIGWFNTDARAYPNLPPMSDLVEVPPDIWDAHYANTNGYAVSAGALVAYTPPPPVLTLAQEAANAAVSGLTIALSGTITLAATLFPTDTKTQKAIESMNAMARAGVLPLGSTTYPMIDASGTWHHFTAAQYQAVAGASAAYVSACDLIAAGNPLGVTELPAASVSLVV